MDNPALSTLDFQPYVDEAGQLPDFFQGKVGVYAIFDRDQVLQYTGYSRDVFLSLRQHLVRQPQHCYWVKVQTIDRPSRTALEAMRESWIAENGATPAGNGADEALWNQPIDVRHQMTPEERDRYETAIDELSQMKCLKNVARRVEAEVLSVLKTRGVQAEIRFNPKLKEEGLLDLK
jgi:hypothetical protein